ncbi:MAG TPA: hypothetical protein VF657_02245 [Actinoplanes sp.]|jgi:hypothetical protein
MAIATAQQRENLAVAYGNAATHASLHAGAPGATGANEVTATGSPAYARKPLTWAAGTVDGTVTATVTFDVPTGTTVTAAGLWTALTAGTFLDSVALTSQAFSSQGTLQVVFTFTQS